MDIATFMSSRFKARLSGDSRNIVMVCPFHNDHPPGHFNMDASTGLWHCYHSSCLKGGNMKSFLKALNMLDQFGNIEIFEISRSAPKEKYSGYLKESTIASFLGKLPVALINEGFERKTLRNKDIGVDEYNYRITFPIRDYTGKLTGISGRAIFEGDTPRYRFYISELQENYPDYRFDKSRNLYNIEDVFPRLYYSREKEPIYIVEGFKACLWMLQHSYKNTVAIMGSSISKNQIDILSKLTNNFILFLDQDEGGISGTIKSGEKLIPYGKVFVVEGIHKQPSDHSKEDLKTVIQNRKSYSSFIMDSKFRRKNVRI